MDCWGYQFLLKDECWIEAMRKSGDPVIRERVLNLLLRDEAAWCSMVQLALWNGVSKPAEKQFKRTLSAIHLLVINEQVWALAFQLAQQCRASGTPVPNTGALVVACFRFHGAGLHHNDKQFDTLLKQ
jgi:predicted nucleic acid-binding protein